MLFITYRTCLNNGLHNLITNVHTYIQLTSSRIESCIHCLSIVIVDASCLSITTIYTICFSLISTAYLKISVFIFGNHIYINNIRIIVQPLAIGEVPAQRYLQSSGRSSADIVNKTTVLIEPEWR